MEKSNFYYFQGIHNKWSESKDNSTFDECLRDKRHECLPKDGVLKHVGQLVRISEAHGDVFMLYLLVHIFCHLQ